MKKILLLLIVCITMLNSGLFAQCGSLYISGVIDGPLSGGTPKGVLVCATADISDLSIFGIGVANNGGGTDGEEFTFPAVQLTNGDCVWVGGTSNGGLVGFNNWFGFDPCYSNNRIDANGDDAYELFCNGSVVDLFGDINTDGSGECWDFLDGWAQRTTVGQSTTFSCADWDFSGVNALDGETSNATAATPFPTPGQVDCTLIPLGVEWASFEVSLLDGQSISLSWKTISEENNSYFEVQHSIDGINFRAIDEVAGNGTTQLKQEYSYTHLTPANGTNYYRLKQVDFDGDFEYSDIRVVDIDRAGKIVINPSAAIAEITIQLTETEGHNNLIGIYDMVGRTVMMSNFDGAQNAKTIDISNLEKGYYVVRVQAGNEIFTERFMKMVD